MRRRDALPALSLAPLVTLAAVALGGGCSGGAAPGAKPQDPWPLDAKLGLRVADMGPVPPLPSWPDNPPTDAKKALGHAMFADARLSGSGRTTCGNCHFPPNDFQSGGPKDAPDRSYPAVAPTLPRNTPSLDNIVYAPMARWDGSYFTNVFDLAVLPFAEANMDVAHALPASDVEGVDLDAAKVALQKKLTVTAPGYVKAFQGAFGQDIRALTPDEVWALAGKAMAVYLRVAVSRDSAFDAWNAGDDAAMSASAVRGLSLFRGRARCAACHSGPLFSDFQFHNIGSSPPDDAGARADEGRFKVTHAAADHGAFLTPTLRSAASTSPYLHDGSEVSLSKVIRRKMDPDVRRRDPGHDPLLDTIAPLDDGEIEDLVAFIEALRGAPLPPTETAGPVALP